MFETRLNGETRLSGADFESAETGTEVGDLSLETEALRLGGQGSVLSELAGLLLDAVQELPHERCEEGMLPGKLFGRQGRMIEQIGFSPASCPGVPLGGKKSRPHELTAGYQSPPGAKHGPN